MTLYLTLATASGHCEYCDLTFQVMYFAAYPCSKLHSSTNVSEEERAKVSPSTVGKYPKYPTRLTHPAQPTPKLLLLPSPNFLAASHPPRSHSFGQNSNIDNYRTSKLKRHCTSR